MCGDPPGTATAADGTHPTGMHSCLAIIPVLRFDSYLGHITYFHILRKTPPDYLSGFHDLISSHQFKLRSLFVPHGDN